MRKAVCWMISAQRFTGLSNCRNAPSLPSRTAGFPTWWLALNASVALVLMNRLLCNRREAGRSCEIEGLPIIGTPSPDLGGLWAGVCSAVNPRPCRTITALAALSCLTEARMGPQKESHRIDGIGTLSILARCEIQYKLTW